MIACVAIVGHASNPLYLQSFTDGDDALKYHYIVHASLDIVDERMAHPKRQVPGVAPNDMYLGLLYPTEDYAVYGYLSNTRIKFIVVVDELDIPDTSIRSFFRRFHAAYVDAASNPFHVPGKRLVSSAFAERVTALVKSFGVTST